jgi:hypothetical protein
MPQCRPPFFYLVIAVVTLLTASAFAGVSVSSPSNSATVGSPVHYVATATSSCAQGVASMGIYTADNALAYVVNGSKLDANLKLNPGTYKTTVTEWDNCGGTDKVQLTINVTAQAGVTVTAPANNATVAGPIHYVASATSGCAKGVSAVGIYTADNVLAYAANGASLDTNLSLNPGTYNTMVQSWDGCGGSAKTPITVTVKPGNQPGVTVLTPTSNSTVSSPVHFVANATSTCAKGVSAIGVYPAAGQLSQVTPGASLDTNLNLSNGSYTVIVQDWDNCGGTSKTPVTISVGAGASAPPPNMNTFANLEAASGWTGYALLPWQNYDPCSGCVSTGPDTTWSWTPGFPAPGNSPPSSKVTKTTIGGQAVYSDVLWNNHLIGDFSSRGLPDPGRNLVQKYSNFVYDVWFYGENLEASEALEFDMNQFFGGESFIWGHECRVQGVLGGNSHEWDIWDNPSEHWVKTGIPCHPLSGQWNHLVLRVGRTVDNKVIFKSIELNGQVSTLNHVEDPKPRNWYGITVNYQIDGDKNQTPYNVYLSNFNFSYY